MKASFTPFFVVVISLCIPASLDAQWIKTDGPPGIRATKFYESNNVLYVGTDAKGVYKSIDHGNTWTPANTGMENMQVLSITGDATYIYAGTGTEGVFRSSNQGATWTAANTGIQTNAVYSLLVAAGQIFAGTIGNGVFKSSNQGTTWTDANGGALGSSFIFAMFYADSRLTVEADNYLFYTFDFGGEWFVDQGSTSFYVIDNFLQKGDTVIAAAGGNVFVTNDGGNSWSDVILVDPDIDILGLDMINDTIYAGHATGLYRSTNWGQSWTNIPTTGLRIGNRYNYHFTISGNNFLLSFEEIGIYKSSNKGLAWTQVPMSYFEPAATIDNALLVSGNTLYAGTHNDGVYSSNDNGDTWSKIGTTNPLDSLSNGIIFSILNPAPNILLAGACGYGLFRSTDNGTSWTHIQAGLPVQDETGYTCINSLAKSGSNVIAATTEGIYYSSNNGLTWTATNIGGPQVLYSSGLAVNGNIVCTGIFSLTLGSGIFRSTNNGVTWTLASNAVIDVLSMASDGVDHMYAGNFNNNYVSDDDGLTWSNVGPGIPFDNGGFAMIAFDNYVFIGNSQGVFFSNNYGDSFSDANLGMDPYPNNAVQGFAKDMNYIYLGTFINGIWRRPLSQFGIGPACPGVVSNTNDSGSGSLRDIVSCSPSGMTITFAPGLTDQTITLTTGEIEINKNLTLSGPGMTHLKISGNNNSRIFHLFPGRSLEIENLSLENGNLPANGGALFVEGHLNLENVLLKNNFSNGVPRAWTATPAALIEIIGTVSVKN